MCCKEKYVLQLTILEQQFHIDVLQERIDVLQTRIFEL